jgi:hypothetical protein
MSDEQAIIAKLDRLGELLFARSSDIVDELWSDGFRLVGSEKGEVAETRAQLEAVVDDLYGRPPRFRWAWDKTSITVENDVAWLFAEGNIVITYSDRADRRPYRMIAIFQKFGGNWRWRLFSGSEPL